MIGLKSNSILHGEAVIIVSEAKLRQMKERIIMCSEKHREGHIPSAFSVLDILWVLYQQVLHINPNNPSDPKRDRFVLSKGHASLGLYVMLAESGFFPYEKLEDFAAYDSMFGGHPDRNKIPGVEASTGSLGHGFPISVGMALGQKIKGENARVFALIGDGEANEGSVWEAVLLASHHKLSNLTCIVDYNHSTDRALRVDDLQKKFEAFGWQSQTIDGHDHSQIFAALNAQAEGKPTAVIAQTIKGKGCRMMENNPAWHHRFPTAEEVPELLEQLS